MELEEENLLSENKFLLNDLLSNGQYMEVRQKFKNFLLAIHNVADSESSVMYHKRRKLDQFKTTVMICKNDSSDLVDEKIERWKSQATEKCFLIYKTFDSWVIVGRNIAGINIDQPLHLFNEADSGIKEKLNNILVGYSSSCDLSPQDPLHLLIVDYFGYFRPSFFISYSWPDRNYPHTYVQDKFNRKAVFEIAEDLSFAGFRVLIDKDDLSPGVNINRFINLIADPKTDYICIMATPLYKAKYLKPSITLEGDNNKTWVEGEAIVSQVLANRNSADKVFILLLEGAPSKSVLPLLVPKIFNRFTTDNYFDTMIRLILAAYKMKRSHSKISELIEEFDNKSPFLRRSISLANPSTQPIALEDPFSPHCRQGSESPPPVLGSIQEPVFPIKHGRLLGAGGQITIVQDTGIPLIEPIGMHRTIGREERRSSMDEPLRTFSLVSITDALADYDHNDPGRDGVRITLNEFFRKFRSQYEHLLSNGQADCSGQEHSLLKFNFTHFNLSYSLFNDSCLTHADFSHSYVFQTTFTNSKIGHCRITSNQLATAAYQTIDRQKCRKIVSREAQAWTMKGLHVYLTFEYKAEVEAKAKAGIIQMTLEPLHFFAANASWVIEKILKHPKLHNQESSRIKKRISRQLMFFRYLREVTDLQPILDESVFQVTDKKRSF